MYFTLPNAGGVPYNVDNVQFHAFRSVGEKDWPTGGLKSGAISLTGAIYVWTDITANNSEQVSYKNVYADYEDPTKRYGTHTLPRLDKSNAYGGSFSLTLMR